MGVNTDIQVKWVSIPEDCLLNDNVELDCKSSSFHYLELLL